MKQAIIDTGVIVALLNKNDTYHQWAINQWKQVQAPAITCEAVISESCFLLKATYLQEILMSMIEAGAIKTQFQFENNVTKI
ncbi:PIN domain-containing protein [Pseudanabaena sp. 'Roaring Creek']|uniref:PIN domain-containing protein n=1 Tax=Pseudanabaena sp. 'Roaring Creek' TaxID=1681830 RepID=UPI000AE44094|nr:PIN domain-containing protein [Pseudanabaena sp. 'Roaring Creek']